MFAQMKVFLLPGCLAALFLSCQSMGSDLRVDAMSAARRGELAELEKMVVPLDGPAGTAGLRAAARTRIAELEKISSADAEYNAALAAWSGRLYIHEGRNSEALRKLKESQALSPGNTPSLILALRLEPDPQKRLTLIDQELRIAGPSTGTGLSSEGAVSPGAALQIERGRVLMDLGRYREAAAAFDTALAGSLPRVYRETYGESRSLAWELRDAPPGGVPGKTLEIMGRQGLIWTDLIELTKTETDLLRFLTAGRDLPGGELFDRLLERSFIPYTQDIGLYDWPPGKPLPEDRVLRSGAAWFLWRLYAENRGDRGILSRYSSRYSRMINPQSPIADLPLLSPFFDAILGCVETEMMSLPDGKNFIPADPVRGSEFLGILKRF
jgi:tetratricopeptide (TPR) repeat protein